MLAGMAIGLGYAAGKTKPARGGPDRREGLGRLHVPAQQQQAAYALQLGYLGIDRI